MEKVTQYELYQVNGGGFLTFIIAGYCIVGMYRLYRSKKGSIKFYGFSASWSS